MKKCIDLTGKKFGRLTIVERAQNSEKYNLVQWLCVCECGEKRINTRSNLRSGNTLSCGCLKREENVKKLTTHGMTKDRFYRIWKGMRRRCKNSTFKNYGGRGIKVCDRWLKSFENFRDDLYSEYCDHVKRYGEHDTSIERKDVNGHYELGNVTFATRTEQVLNRRTRNDNNSGYVGVYKNRVGTWTAQINRKGTRWQKNFRSVEEATRAREEKMREMEWTDCYFLGD